ncbi:MAG: ABC transporter ATP-binding protein [Clostridiaceae bacterium]|nr:ABC transporter ATP-binding protein [Clostridiaceae bacterium]
MSIIKTKGLVKTYGKKDAAVHALRGVDLEVQSGEFLAVIGPSGSGKSTLLHLLGGVDRATEGSILVEDKELSGFNEKQLSLYRRRRIGFVFQYYNLVPVLTVEENISLPLMLDGLKPDQEWLEELLTRLNLQDKRHSLPNQLSGGQQQRTAMARALIHRPALVLADEPTGNLDSQNGREIMALLRDTVRRVGQTLILITHDHNIAAQADRIMVIEDGLIRPMSVVSRV